MATKASRTVVIVPTYNERPNIQKLVPAFAQVVKGLDREVLMLVVDDSSPDGTAEEVEKLAKKYPFLRLLINKKKSGLGGAYLKGMAHAFGELKADVAMQMDADLSHDPKKIPMFLEAIDNGADLVLGSRYIQGGSIPSNWGLHRKFLSVIGNMFISFVLTSVAVRDWTTGYRALRKEVYEKVHAELSGKRFTGYTFQIGFLHKALRNGFAIKEIPFHFIDRTIGESKLGMEYIINTIKYVMSVRIQEIISHRLFKFLAVGGLGFVINFVAFRVLTMLSLGKALFVIPGYSSLTFLHSVLSDRGLAVVLGAELAIISNYTLNNFWTFKDRKINGVLAHLSKFAQFNLGSVGSVVIQYLTMQAAVAMFGIFTVFTLMGIGIKSDDFYLAAGVLLGMIWNFTVYSKVIWRKK